MESKLSQKVTQLCSQFAAQISWGECGAVDFRV
jgi:hypothetical protein